MVGNDFAVFDQAWVRAKGEWKEWPSLEATTHSTMSFDLGDVDNDGAFELFATDMKPYVDDAETAAAAAVARSPMYRQTLAIEGRTCRSRST